MTKTAATHMECILFCESIVVG